MSSDNLGEMWNELSNFVKEVCEGRDESHGHAHMKAVAENSHRIFTALYREPNKNSDMYLKTIAVAWLHDVNDHKYDKDGSLTQKIKDFLKLHFNPEDSQLISKIILRISYSKENKVIQNGEKLDWEEVLGEEGCKIRDIVSDADKIEALGSIGLKRCAECGIHLQTEKTGKKPTEKELAKHILEHSDEKLLRLKDEFIRTKPGNDLAEPLHLEMVEKLDMLKRGEVKKFFDEIFNSHAQQSQKWSLKRINNQEYREIHFKLKLGLRTSSTG